MDDYIFRHIKVYELRSTDDSSTRISADIPHTVFDIMSKDKVLEFFRKEPGADTIEYLFSINYHVEEEVLCVTYHNSNENLLNLRRERLIEFDKKIDELKREQQ